MSYLNKIFIANMSAIGVLGIQLKFAVANLCWNFFYLIIIRIGWET